MAFTSSATFSSSMDCNVSQNQPPQSLIPAASYSVAPLFSQNDVSVGMAPTAHETTSFSQLKLDVDGCLRELRKRQLETEEGERDGTGSNRRIGWGSNLSIDSISGGASTSSPSTLANIDGPSVSPIKTRLKFVLEKQLTKSDVSTAGRIILPKKKAEAKLPVLEDKWGITLTVRDALSSDKWRMKYRYWPNSHGRIYVLENTGDFIRKNNLKSGDSIAIYQDDSKRNFICVKKIESLPYPSELAAYEAYEEDDRKDNNQTVIQINEHLQNKECANSSRIVGSPAIKPTGNPAIELPTGNPRNSWGDGLGVDADLSDFSNRNLTRFGRFPSFDDCDLYLFDFRSEENAANQGKTNK